MNTLIDINVKALPVDGAVLGSLIYRGGVTRFGYRTASSLDLAPTLTGDRQSHTATN